MKSLLLIFGCLISSLGFAQNFPVASSVGNTPKIDLSKINIVQRLGGQVPMDARFTDRDGALVKFGDLLKNRPAIVLPIFYRCQGVCSVEMESLLAELPKLKQKIGKDFDMIVLSIDPQEGTDLAEHKFESTVLDSDALKPTASGWHFLCGDLKNIRSVTDALGFHYTYDAQRDIINHPSGIMFLTSSGEISSYILGANYDPAKLSLNINVADAHRLGQKSTELFFGCIYCDPITGKKSIVITRFLSLLAGITVIAIVATITTLSIRSKRSSAA